MNALAQQVDGQSSANTQPSNSQPGQISISVKVQNQQAVSTLQLNLDPNSSFQELVAYLNMKIFAAMQKNQVEDIIEYKFGNEVIRQDETRTLNQLGLKNGSSLEMKMKLKGGH